MNEHLTGPHQSIQFPLTDSLMAAILQSGFGGTDALSNFLFCGKARFTGFIGGIHEGTQKEPDCCVCKQPKSICYSDSEGTADLFPRLVVEVGGETWDEMRLDASVWLDGTDGAVRVVILVKVEESDGDRVDDPLVLREDGEFVEDPPVRFYRPLPAEENELSSRGRYAAAAALGPKIYKNYAVTGSMKVTTEVWRPASQEEKARGDCTPKCSFKGTLADANPNVNAEEEGVKDYINLRKSDFDLVPEGEEDGELRLEVGRHRLLDHLWNGTMQLMNYRVAQAVMDAKGIEGTARLERVIVEPEGVQENLEEIGTSNRKIADGKSTCNCRKSECTNRQCGCKRRGTACTTACHPGLRRCGNESAVPVLAV
ncbi:hypothetical protein BDN72DRAFT_838572 [Pluteus cervinus]|uniref:Uncharacterized protein n=1 Tax=Pluteus cervinus TaxID=181527 RepID=A0ACD3AYD6_9AGAR|nr:hypothetical protein BDN72DRAFT_838572 [Pluteus cervinus]